MSPFSASDVQSGKLPTLASPCFITPVLTPVFVMQATCGGAVCCYYQCFPFQKKKTTSVAAAAAHVIAAALVVLCRVTFNSSVAGRTYSWAAHSHLVLPEKGSPSPPAPVVLHNIFAGRGVIHGIHGILLPAGKGEASSADKSSSSNSNSSSSSGSSSGGGMSSNSSSWGRHLLFRGGREAEARPAPHVERPPPRAEPPRPVEQPRRVEPPRPVEQPRPVQQPRPVEQPWPVEQPRPAATPYPNGGGFNPALDGRRQDASFYRWATVLTACSEQQLQPWHVSEQCSAGRVVLQGLTVCCAQVRAQRWQVTVQHHLRWQLLSTG